MRILIADDESVSRRMLQALLAKWGYDVVSAEDGDAAWEKLKSADAPRMALLDWMMPGQNGVDVCRALRKLRPDPYTYILLLTAKDAKESVVEGLESGADDYLTKPFSPRTLLAHVRALLRRTGIEQPVSLDAGDLRLNSEDHTMSVRGAVAHLTNRELRLVQYLVANVGRPVPAERLTTHIWGYQGTGDRQLLKQIVHRVRQKIEHDPAAPRYLVTVAGVGYMLRATPADMPVVVEPDDELSTPSAVCRNDGRTDL
jgi:DNA-binding response OmpR family regulator